MSISNKIKAVLHLTDKDDAGLAAHLGIARQSLRNKFVRNSFSADELVRVADYCGVEIAYKIDEKQQVVLDITDVREISKNETE